MESRILKSKLLNFAHGTRRIEWALAVAMLLLGTYQLLGAQQPQEHTASIHQLFVQDQKDRKTPSSATPEQWAKIRTRDAERRRLAHQMLESGAIQTGKDFKDASFIFQHGDSPQDYLLAHILAIAALSKGEHSARWIAAATLDRYLQSINQPQVFGTQYRSNDSQTIPHNATQAPYNSALLTDAMRKDFCIPSSEVQRQNLIALNQGKTMQLSGACP